ncbi:MAG TPA: hypothetical protein VM290_01500 [Gaiellaceae bacterium]|nr:hypothetical protein [Gaiellaceae bacterium]
MTGCGRGGSLWTGVVLAGVVLVVAFAAADALRGREPDSAPEPRPAETEVPPEDPGPNPGVVHRLRAEGVAGTLVVADANCRVVSVELPELEATARPGVSCVVGHPEPAEQLPLGDDELRRTGVSEPRVLDQVRLSPSRAAVLLSSPGGGYVLGIFEGGELVASHRWGGEGPGRLVAAPGGALFAAPPARVFRRDGTPVRLAPRFRNARAVAWSPDGAWAALAMVGATTLVPTHALVGGAEARRAIRLPYPARDVAWRETRSTG